MRTCCCLLRMLRPLLVLAVCGAALPRAVNASEARAASASASRVRPQADRLPRYARPRLAHSPRPLPALAQVFDFFVSLDIHECSTVRAPRAPVLAVGSSPDSACGAAVYAPPSRDSFWLL